MCRNPLHCVVPPFVLSRVADRGSPKQRAWALRTLDADTTIRHARSVNAKAIGRKGAREGHDALAAAAAARRTRSIMDAKHGWEVTGLRRVRDEDDGPTGDPAVDEAFDGLGATWDFWQNVFSRDSIDNENMPLRGIVHFGEEYPNAFWDGRRMVFGDGDDEIFLRFTKSLDVIGHELGHGVIEDESGLEYWGQSGALNEHFADVAGVMVKQHKLGQTADEADWLIGADLRGDEFDGDALRSMKAPGTAYDDAVPGQGPAARPLAPLRAHVRGQRRRPHQLGDRQQGLLPARHQPRRQVLARPGPHLVRRAAQPAAHHHRLLPAVRADHPPGRAAALRPGIGPGQGGPGGVGRGRRALGMRIEVRQQGGFAGLRRPPLVVETEDLEPGPARELEELAAALPAGGPPGRGADLMRYDVLVDDASGRRTAAFFEPDVPQPVRELLKLAREAGRRA